jgi:hypothetical protein
MRGLRCVGVIGPNNAPLHVTTVSDVAGSAADTDANAFLHVLHCALDEVESRLGVGTLNLDRAGFVSGGQRPKTETSAHPPETSSRDPFLGMVFPTEAHVAYAYATNTRAVFVLVFDDTAGPFAESDVRRAFAVTHDAFADAMSDPFATPGARLESARFARKTRSLLTDA